MPDLKGRSYKPFIIVLSVFLPVTVTILYLIPKCNITGFDVHILPLINAWINGATFFTLIAAFIAIKNNKRVSHQRLMTVALVLSVFFLIIYVFYHAVAESTKFEGEGIIKTVYYSVLLSHIFLAAVIAPLVLVTYVRALSEKFDKHRKIARITLPIWLYVSVSGVIVYLLISPYYH